jgi:hypothetical protein
MFWGAVDISAAVAKCSWTPCRLRHPSGYLQQLQRLPGYAIHSIDVHLATRFGLTSGAACLRCSRCCSCAAPMHALSPHQQLLPAQLCTK